MEQLLAGIVNLVSTRRNLVLVYESASDRIITTKPDVKPCKLNIIQIYAQTSNTSDEEIDEFCKKLETK